MITNDSNSKVQAVNFDKPNDKQFMQRKYEDRRELTNEFFNIAVMRDPLKKREQFAVSLRK